MAASGDGKENHVQEGHSSVSDTDRGHAYVHVLADVLNRIVEENDTVSTHLGLLDLNPFFGTVSTFLHRKEMIQHK